MARGVFFKNVVIDRCVFFTMLVLVWGVLHIFVMAGASFLYHDHNEVQILSGTTPPKCWLNFGLEFRQSVKFNDTKYIAYVIL